LGQSFVDQFRRLHLVKSTLAAHCLDEGNPKLLAIAARCASHIPLRTNFNGKHHGLYKRKYFYGRWEAAVVKVARKL